MLSKNQSLPPAFELASKCKIQSIFTLIIFLVSNVMGTPFLMSKNKETQIFNVYNYKYEILFSRCNEENFDSLNIYGDDIMGGEMKYIGNLKNGKKHGYGILKFKDGLEYKGQFADNFISGYGIIKCHEKNYEGFWEKNQKHGEGIETYCDGRIYRGNFLYDKKDGYGEFSWPNGSRFKGTFKAGKQDGEGIFIFSNGSVKRGLWKNGKRVNWIEEINPPNSATNDNKD